jgi:hypothetical protein
MLHFFVLMVWQAEGDLGTIAQSSKATQRTLGFGSAPKPLDIQGETHSAEASQSSRRQR